MKILYLSSAVIPSRTANSLQVMKMCSAMVQEGHEVRLACPSRGMSAPPARDELMAIYGTGDPVVPEYWAWPGSPLGTIAYALRGRMAARDSLVYTREPVLAAICAAVRARTVLEMHQPPEAAWARKALGRVCGRIGGGRVKVVAISDALRQEIAIQAGVSDVNQIAVAPDGVDVEAFRKAPGRDAARSTLGLPADVTIAGYAGSLYPGKGADQVLEAARRLPDVHFAIVGGGERLAELKSVAGESLSNLTFAGQVGNAEIPMWLSACDILLLPNQSKVEGSGGGDIGRWTSPLKMFEYMAAGRPIVSSDLPVLREVLDDEIAELVSPADPDAMAQAIQRLANDPARRASMGAEARRRAERYSWRGRVRLCVAGIEK